MKINKYLAIITAALTFVFISRNLWAIEITRRDNSFKPVTEAFYDVDGDGQEENIRITKTNMGRWTNWQLAVARRQDMVAEEFILGYSARDPHLGAVKLKSEDKTFIRIDAPGGSDEWDMALYSLTDKGLRKEMTFFSDWPYIEIKDIDEDGDPEIIVSVRDYEADPAKDSHIYTYTYEGGSWILKSMYGAAEGAYMIPGRDSFQIREPETT